MKKILIVEDLAFTRNAMRKMLVNGGYQEIFDAADAAEAIECFKREQPALVLLDITLPDRKDLSLLEEMLAFNPEAKTIMCSAVNQMTVINRAKELGALDYYLKPVEEEKLLAAVSEIFA